jgi:hypothetical protein
MTPFEIVLGAITAITMTSLTLSYKWIKIQRKWKIEDSLPPAPPKPPPTPPKLDPFLEIKDGTPCPKCLAPAKEAVTVRESGGWVRTVSAQQGPRPPYACNDSSCLAKNMGMEHLHTSCLSCHLVWLMKTADQNGEEVNGNPEAEKCQ